MRIDAEDLDREEEENLNDRDPETFDPRVINPSINNLRENRSIPIYGVTNLLKEDYRHL